MVIPSNVLSALAAFGRSNPDFDFTGVEVYNTGSDHSWYATCRRTLWSDDHDASTEINLREWAPDPLNALCFLADEIQEITEELRAELAKDERACILGTREPCNCTDCAE
jgi:hypothetical protein